MTAILIGRAHGLTVISGVPGRWQAAEHFAGRDVQCLAADPLRPEVVYCGTFGQGLWRSDDAGVSWHAVGAGIAHPQLMAVAVSVHERHGDSGVVYAGTEPSALFRSMDGGATWRESASLRALPSAPTWSFPPRPYTSHVRAITLDPELPDRLFVCIEAGALIQSADGGETWTDRVPDGPWDTHTLLVHPHTPGRLYSSAGDGFMLPGRGYSESDDAGRTWRRPDDGLRHHYLWGAAVDPADPETVVVSAASSPNQAHNPANAEAYVYRRSGDSAWEAVTAGLPVGSGMLAAVLASRATEPGAFYAAANTGLYHSADAGRSWQSVLTSWPEQYRTEHINALVVTDPA